MIVPVILVGGMGTRLWPLSAGSAPKQFQSIAGGSTMFQQTLDRVCDRGTFARPIIVASQRQAHQCEQALGHAGAEALLILEPIARNTAAAVAMAANVVGREHGKDTLMLVMPSDHLIDDQEGFIRAVASGVEAARSDRLVTFGIPATRAETGYGYIQIGDEIAGATGAREAAQFVEKPNAYTAEKFVADGDYLWNAGIFLFRAGSFLREIEQMAADIAKAATEAIAQGDWDHGVIRPDAASLADCPSRSIDHAVMERSSRVAVVPADFGWADVGSWDAVADLAQGETPIGPVTTVDCDGCYIRSDGIEVAALGLRDLIIVASGRQLLVMPRGRSQEVKRLLEKMESTDAGPVPGAA